MSSPAQVHVSQHSVRRMVRQLRHHATTQRHTVMECRNIAESLTAAGIAFATAERLEQASDHDITTEKAQRPVTPPLSGVSANVAAMDSLPVCFVEVASEKDIRQNLVLDGPLSGVAVAVLDALDVQEFRTRSGVDAPLFHRGARKEFPLVSWLRRQGASFVGKLSCRTPLALNEGCVFGRDKPASIAVAARACHFSINCSLNGPSSIACCVGHDVVGFKPTSQTFGTFTEQFSLAIPSMTVGITANRVDDLLYLWQVYTAAIDAEAYVGGGDTGGGSGGGASAATTNAGAAAAGGDASASAAAVGGDAPAGAAAAAASTEAASVEATSPAAASVEERTSSAPTANAQSAPDGQATGDTTSADGAGAPAGAYYNGGGPVYARPEIIDHSPRNYTVKDRRGRMADIDVGWRDYNAESSETEEGGRAERPGFVRRMLVGEAQPYVNPRVELAVGYPAEWIGMYCQRMYGTAHEFHQRLTDSVYYRSALHKNQKLEIIPLAFDFTIEDVIRATNIISHFELARAFDKLFYGGEVGSSNSGGGGTETSTTGPGVRPARETPLIRVRGAGPKAASVPLDLRSPSTADRPSTFNALAGVLEELPREVAESVRRGQMLTEMDYNSALRVRDDVVRATEEQFQDVDAFVVPLLAEPYVTGDMRSIALTLPFHLAGNPILSVQMDKDLPIALIGELGRDAALLEDSFCFLQFVRGASPKWWRQKVFGEK